jgi:hypothetical protein
LRRRRCCRCWRCWQAPAARCAPREARLRLHSLLLVRARRREADAHTAFMSNIFCRIGVAARCLRRRVRHRRAHDCEVCPACAACASLPRACRPLLHAAFARGCRAPSASARGWWHSLGSLALRVRRTARRRVGLASFGGVTYQTRHARVACGVQRACTRRCAAVAGAAGRRAATPVALNQLCAACRLL